MMRAALPTALLTKLGALAELGSCQVIKQCLNTESMVEWAYDLQQPNCVLRVSHRESPKRRVGCDAEMAAQYDFDGYITMFRLQMRFQNKDIVAVGNRRGLTTDVIIHGDDPCIPKTPPPALHRHPWDQAFSQNSSYTQQHTASVLAVYMSWYHAMLSAVLRNTDVVVRRRCVPEDPAPGQRKGEEHRSNIWKVGSRDHTRV
ncbi:hypothetical protein QBC45DRAFT_430305 [Copromyces sp. CBS 386.78]|nr:hypothetical protein QBC45DRAFT_430305 [Copromyces sp. CBS 386.78]